MHRTSGISLQSSWTKRLLKCIIISHRPLRDRLLRKSFSRLTYEYMILSTQKHPRNSMFMIILFRGCFIRFHFLC